MNTLQLPSVLKKTTLKFTYHALNVVPLLFLFLGKEQVYYSIFAAFFAWIAVYFLRREIKRFLPAQE